VAGRRRSAQWILLILVATGEILQEFRISANPAAAIGTVMEKDLIEGGEETPDRCTLRYSFATQSDAEQRKWATVDPETYDRVTENATPPSSGDVQAFDG
jgi:hypothetical protein